MKTKILKILPVLSIAVGTTTTLPTMSSCSNSIQSQLSKMPRVSKVEKLDDMPGFNERYLVWFKHPVDWNNESKGYFEQRCEVNIRDTKAINQLFTCGYELRNFKPDRANDFEIANRYLGNVIKPEFRFFDKSVPTGLSYEKVEGWENLTNANAMQDFHSMITALKTIFTGKWAFTGTSKGGETTNMFAMTYPDDCDLYVPYVAPRLYARNNEDFTNNIYYTIGDEVLGKTICDEYRTEITKFQWFLLQNKDTIYDGTHSPITKVIEESKKYKYSEYITNKPQYLFYLCLSDFACGFWQYDQDIKALRDVNNETDNLKRIEKSINHLLSISGVDGYSMDCLFFPYFYQACTEMGENRVNFEQMIDTIATYSKQDKTTISNMIEVPGPERNDFYFRVLFNDAQYQAWYVNKEQDMTMANKLIEWNKTCKVPVFMIYGGADTWYHLRLNENQKSDSIHIYVGKDTKNAWGRTHKTRISSLLPADQLKVWQEIDKILGK